MITRQSKTARQSSWMFYKSQAETVPPTWTRTRAVRGIWPTPFPQGHLTWCHTCEPQCILVIVSGDSYSLIWNDPPSQHGDSITQSVQHKLRLNSHILSLSSLGNSRHSRDYFLKKKKRSRLANNFLRACLLRRKYFKEQPSKCATLFTSLNSHRCSGTHTSGASSEFPEAYPCVFAQSICDMLYFAREYRFQEHLMNCG